jgi:phospholipase/carboxylesterase
VRRAARPCLSAAIVPKTNTIREAGTPRGWSSRAGVLLHGRGHTADEKVDLAARLGTLGGMRWLAPGADLGSWYPNRFWDPVESNEPFLTEAVGRCDEAVDEASEGGRLRPEQIAIVGFSQGACIALEYALRHPGRVRTLIVFTGGLMGEPGTDWKAAGSLQGIRVLLTGSDADDWIPEDSTRETAGVLSRLGADVTLRLYHGRPHIVGDEELAEARAILEHL